jgi:UDP-2,3-diacylglucosamine pyrophosphatase LpxH
MTNCPYCKSSETGVNKRPNKYLCRACGKYFTVHGISLAQDPEENSLEPISKLEVTLDSPKKDRVGIVPIGDIHVGSGQCDWDKVLRELDYILNTPDTYMLGMGDYCDMASKMVRKGPCVFDSTLSPMQQYEKIYNAFRPLAEQGKVLGLLRGNHEEWIHEDSGIDIVSLLCRELRVPYLGSACDLVINVNAQRYAGYILHGSSNAKTSSSKLVSLLNITKDIYANFFIMGHVHQIAVAKTSKRIDGKEIKCYYVTSGHFLKFEGGYAQTFGMSSSPTGTAKIMLFADRFDIHISV